MLHLDGLDGPCQPCTLWDRACRRPVLIACRSRIAEEIRRELPPMSIGHALQVAFVRAHKALYQKTDGLVGHRLVGVPSLLLHTTGRRSGLRRTAVLAYARDGSDLVVVASNDGRDDPPAWLLNVRAEPAVAVQLASHRAAGLARVVEPDDPDFRRLWDLVNEVNHHRYEGYQRRTTRPISLVAVTPSDDLHEEGA